MEHKHVFTVACGAGFAGDRTDAAVNLVRSSKIGAIGLECLAERTLVPGLRARQSNSDAGADPRLDRRLRPLLGPARESGCKIISNLGAANPSAAGRAVASLAGELGLHGLRVAAVIGDDVLGIASQVMWNEPVLGKLLGAHAYLGADAMAEGVGEGADVIVTGRVADSALFSAPVVPFLDGSLDALAGATGVGHILECSGQVTGGNFEMPCGDSLSAEMFANLGFPVAHVATDGSAIITLADGASGRVDALTATLQLLYEVHDPSAYITPDAVLDFTGVTFDEIGPNQVLMRGVRGKPAPSHLKVSGFVDQPGVIADVEIGYAGTHALRRAELAADALRLRLSAFCDDEIRIDLVGVNSTLGKASLRAPLTLPEVRVHVSAACPDAQTAQIVEDEVYGLTLSGPAGGGSVRSERRPRLAVIDGLIPREKVSMHTEWRVA
jgi:hypothetical protein